MAIIRDRAVVLRRFDYSETSQVIFFFTRDHGKVRVIAKGVKRSTKARFAAAVDLLEVGQVACSDRAARSESLATMTEWRQSRCFAGLREKLARIHAGQYAAEVTAMLTEDWDPHPGLYDGLVELVAVVSESDDPLPAVVRFQRVLLEEVGSAPRFDVCMLCGRTQDMVCFSSLEGGMVCRHCEPSQVEKRAVRAPALAVLGGRDHPGGAAGAFDVLNYHIAHLAGKTPLLGAHLSSVATRGNVR